MIYPSSESMRKVGSKYKLVLMAAQRSKQIKAGMKPLIETESTNPLTIAFEEIAAGEVFGETPDIDEIDTQVLEDIARNEETEETEETKRQEGAEGEYEAEAKEGSDSEYLEQSQDTEEQEDAGAEEETSFTDLF
ncbi:MAG: DNA-directed RNA polymerase subunit omega [Abditibacteriota bacterium]|nr:DNA-directed RNA polymerase subunit omega [Abditibacteriota bacterium]